MNSRPILHVIETNGPGGAETVLLELVRRMAVVERPCIAVIPTTEGWLGRKLPKEVQRVIKTSARGQGGPVDLPYLRSLRAAIKRERPVLVHAHSFDTTFYASLAAMGLRTPVIATFHGRSDAERRGPRNRLKWAVVARTSTIACVSESLANYTRSVPGAPQRRVVALLNGCDLSRFSGVTNGALRSQLGLSAGTLILGALDNIRAPKGYNQLLDAVALLRARGLDVHLTIAGDDRGTMGEALRARRSALGLDPHVTFLGFVDDAASYLEGLDIFVLSSTSEGFSLSTVQAMAASRPIVATRSGGPEELIEDVVSGLLVAPHSPEALMEGIERLATTPHFAATLGATARKRSLAHFSIERMVGGYSALYREVLGR